MTPEQRTALLRVRSVLRNLRQLTKDVMDGRSDYSAFVREVEVALLEFNRATDGVQNPTVSPEQRERMAASKALMERSGRMVVESYEIMLGVADELCEKALASK